MDEKMLVAFGNYLLSDKRKEQYRAVKIKGHSLKERLSEVSDADVRNFIDEYRP